MRKTKTFLMLALLFIVTMVNAQDNDFETNISADVVNQYIWRGQDLGNVSVQPTLGISYKGLSLTGWGSVGLSNSDDTKEIDLTLAYTIGGFNVGVTDYWVNEGQDPHNWYIMYDAHKTNHVFEANVGYDFGLASIQWFTNFAGNDGCNKDGNRAYSSYVEVAAPFQLGGVEWTATVGAVPYSTDYYGANGFAVTNLSLMAEKSISITDKFSLPIFAAINTNPHSQKAYLVFGLTLQP